MNNDDLAAEIFARLEAIERHIGMRAGSSDSRRERNMSSGPERFGPGRRRGGFDAPHLGGPRSNRDHGGCDCLFNEKRTVDKIVELVTERLEEMLRVLPQLIQIETRPTRQETRRGQGANLDSEQPHSPA